MAQSTEFQLLSILAGLLFPGIDKLLHAINELFFAPQQWLQSRLLIVAGQVGQKVQEFKFLTLKTDERLNRLTGGIRTTAKAGL